MTTAPKADPCIHLALSTGFYQHSWVEYPRATLQEIGLPQLRIAFTKHIEHKLIVGLRPVAAIFIPEANDVAT